jgi:hypothetical protein
MIICQVDNHLSKLLKLCCANIKEKPQHLQGLETYGNLDNSEFWKKPKRNLNFERKEPHAWAHSEPKNS